MSLQNIEILSVVMNLIFLYLYIQENKFGWLCGIVGSLLGAYIVYCVNLYSEMGLYLFYAVMGAFAFVVWQVKDGENFVIKRMKPQMIILTIITGIVLSLGLGYRMSSTDAEKPFWDAISTVFGVIATFLEIYKYYVAWSFWVVINVYSTFLYFSTELYFYAGQGVLYTIMSVYGLLAWEKKINSV